MLYFLAWIVYGLIVGSIAKWLHPGEDPMGFIPTVLIGIAGSMVGGFINYFVSGAAYFNPAGVVMGIIGGVICCWTYRTYRLERFVKLKMQQLKKDDK